VRLEALRAVFIILFNLVKSLVTIFLLMFL